MFRNKTILVAGGTGSFEKALAKYMIDSYKALKALN
jgi:FlaA1/EpsC-like NDP-sugar epimerase